MIIEGKKRGKPVGYTSVVRDHFTQVHQSQIDKGEMAGMICANCSTVLHATKRRADKVQRFDLADQLKKHLLRAKKLDSDHSAQKCGCLMDAKDISMELDAQTIRLKHFQKSADRHHAEVHAVPESKKRKRDRSQVWHVRMVT